MDFFFSSTLFSPLDCGKKHVLPTLVCTSKFDHHTHNFYLYIICYFRCLFKSVVSFCFVVVGDGGAIRIIYLYMLWPQMIILIHAYYICYNIQFAHVAWMNSVCLCVWADALFLRPLPPPPPLPSSLLWLLLLILCVVYAS